MHKLKLIGESHTDPAAMKAICDSLEQLQVDGFNVLFLEGNPVENAGGAECILLYNYFKYQISLHFKDAVPAIDDMSKLQKNVIAIYRERSKKYLIKRGRSIHDATHISQNFPDQEIRAAIIDERGIMCDNSGKITKGRELWLKEKVRLIRKARDLSLVIQHIDVDDDDIGPTSCPMERRNTEMVLQILATLDKVHDANGIVIVGMAHLFEMRETTDVEKGMIQLMMDQNRHDITYEHYLLYSDNHAREIQPALQAISQPGNTNLILSCQENTNIIPINTNDMAQDVITDALCSEETKLSPEEEANALREEGNDFYKHNNYAQALEKYNSALSILPTLAPAWLNKGLVHRQLGEEAEAQAAFEEAIRNDESYTKAYFNLTKLLIAIGEYDKAERTKQRGMDTTTDKKNIDQFNNLNTTTPSQTCSLHQQATASTSAESTAAPTSVVKHTAALKLDGIIHDGHFHIIEFGHSHSGNSGFDDFFYQLFSQLTQLYGKVYLSGKVNWDLPLRMAQAAAPNNSNYLAPTCIASDEIKRIYNEEGIVILRDDEVPSQIRAIELSRDIQAANGTLHVFDSAESITLVSYEKLLMQRLQILLGCENVIPTALVDVTKDNTEQLRAQGFEFRDHTCVVKPAFAAGGCDYCLQQGDHVINQLTTFHNQKTREGVYTRTTFAADRISYSQPYDCFTQIMGNETKMQFALDRLTHPQNPNDPYYLVQHHIQADYRNFKGQVFTPTVRLFVLIHQEGEEISIQSLGTPIYMYPEKSMSMGVTTASTLGNVSASQRVSPLSEDDSAVVMNYLNSSSSKTYFAEILSTPFATIIDRLTEVYPELADYMANTIHTYPAYRFIMNNDQSARNEVGLMGKLIRLFQYVNPMAFLMIGKDQRTPLVQSMRENYRYFKALDDGSSTQEKLGLNSSHYCNVFHRFFQETDILMKNSSSNTDRLLLCRLTNLRVCIDQQALINLNNPDQFRQWYSSLMNVLISALKPFFTIYPELAAIKLDQKFRIPDSLSDNSVLIAYIHEFFTLYEEVIPFFGPDLGVEWQRDEFLERRVLKQIKDTFPLPSNEDISAEENETASLRL